MLDQFRSRHVRLRPLAGAEEALHLLEKSGDWKAALATGSWRESAEVKLMNAMLPVDKIPLFSAAGFGLPGRDYGNRDQGHAGQLRCV